MDHARHHADAGPYCETCYLDGRAIADLHEALKAYGKSADLAVRLDIKMTALDGWRIWATGSSRSGDRVVARGKGRTLGAAANACRQELAA